MERVAKLDDSSPTIIPLARNWWPRTALRILLAVAVIGTLGVSLLLPSPGMHHFIYLANAFMHGSFAVNDLPSIYADKVVVGDNIYLPLAPLPGILLMPFAGIFGTGFDEQWLAYGFTVANLLLTWALLKRLAIESSVRRWLSLLFFSGTVYLSALVIGRSWFLAHMIAMTFLLLAINETLSQRRVWLVGVWMGLAFLTRSPTIFALPFFIWMLKPAQVTWRRPAWLFAAGAKLGLGLAVPFLFFFYYNYSRFGGPLETGYGHAFVGSPVLVDALKLGLFSLAHIPKNLYALLLAVPQAYPSLSAPALAFPYIYPSPWGMGIFFTTPAFVYIFAAKWHERLVRPAWLAVGLVLAPLITYYGVGWFQFGYRYALDLYPFLFVLTALGMARRFDSPARALVVISVVINIWGAWWQMIGFRALPWELLVR